MRAAIKRIVMNLYCYGWLPDSVVTAIFNRLNLSRK